MKVVAMIPARLGSKRIKNKNLRLLAGKPLVCHVADTAKEADVFDEIYINSESDIFKAVADEFCIKCYKRPEKLAGDYATNDMFVTDFINNVECDIIVQINPTSPLLTVEDVRSFVKRMVEEELDTLHSVTEEHIEGLFDGKPLNFDPCKQMPRSQDLKPIMLFSSGIMAWRVEAYRRIMKRFNAGTYGADGKVGYFVLRGFSTIDIDQEEDFRIAELAIDYRKNPHSHHPQYYESKDKLHTETDVMDILKRDGVNDNDFNEENQLISNMKEIIEKQDNSVSWSKRIVNTDNNSATLISQLPGEGNRLHHHNDWIEWWYILAGEWNFEIEGKTHIVKEGDVVVIPKNNWHKITAVGDRPAVRLAVSKDKVAHIYKENE